MPESPQNDSTTPTEAHPTKDGLDPIDVISTNNFFENNPLSPTTPASPSLPYDLFQTNFQSSFNQCLNLLVDKINNMEKRQQEFENNEYLKGLIKSCEDQKASGGVVSFGAGGDKDVEIKELTLRVEKLEASVKTLAFNISGSSEPDPSEDTIAPLPEETVEENKKMSRRRTTALNKTISEALTRDNTVHVAEKKEAEYKTKEMAAMKKLQDAAKNAAKLRAKQDEMKLMEKEQNKKIKEAQEMMERMAGEQAQAMFSKMEKMKFEMEEMEARNKSELVRLEKEANNKLRLVEEEANRAREDALKSKEDLIRQREKILMQELERKSKTDEVSFLAFNAAKARAAMSPTKRERARKRWKWACRKVISPASKMKRAMANMLDKKVDANLTVISRVEVLEKYIVELESELRNTKKNLLSSMKDKIENNVNKDQNQTVNQLKYLNEQQTKMSYKWDEYMESILGTKTHVATRVVNAFQNTDSRPPVLTHEPTHVDRVVKSLMAASKTASEKLSQKLVKLSNAFKVGEYDDITFDSNAVAFDIFNILHEHNEELKNYHHITRKCEDSAFYDKEKNVYDIKGHKSNVARHRATTWGEEDKDFISNENGMTLKDVLRLEMFKLASHMSLNSSFGSNSTAQKMEDLVKYLEAEIQRLEKKNASDMKDFSRKVNIAVENKLRGASHDAELATDQIYDEFGSKVNNIQSLLDLKAERQEVREEIDHAMEGINSSLHEVKSSLPQQGIVNKIKETLSEKASRHDLIRVKKQLKALSTDQDRDDPGLSKRCLSCDRPIVNDMQTIELINQANLKLTQMSKSGFANTGMLQRPESAAGDIFGHGGNRSWKAQKGAGANSPYKNFKGSKRTTARGEGTRPQSAGTNRRAEKERARKFGVEKPLHVALFDYDKKKIARSNFESPISQGGEGPGGISVSVSHKQLTENLKMEQELADNKPVM